eukprot:SAG22_NODE_3695_length_1572_cov_1.479973_2_plen_157_part_00
MFEQVDADKSGSLNKDEIYYLVKTLGLSLSGNQLDQAMAEMDADGSGQVLLDEFDDWWMQQREGGGGGGGGGGVGGGIFSSLGTGVLNLTGARAGGNALAAKVRQRPSLLKAVITAFPSVSLPFLAVPLPSQGTVAIGRSGSACCTSAWRRPAACR